MVVCVRVLITAILKSGDGGADLRTWVDGL